MKEIIKLGLILFVICAIAAFSLGMTNELTKGIIEENTHKANVEARKEVFSDADSFELQEDDVAKKFYSKNPQVVEVYKAMSGSKHVGFVIKTAPSGYGGALEVVVGFDLDGLLTGVRVGNHQETPGLGAKAKTEKFYLQYDGLTIKETVNVTKLDVVDTNNEIQAISGATITSDAVTNGVNLGKLVLDTFK